MTQTQVARPEAGSPTPPPDSTEPSHKFSIARIRDADEFRSIPGMDVASVFAEATNILSTSHLKPYLHRHVEYRSGWGRFRCRGRRRLLAWLNVKFAAARDQGGYRSQVVVLPDGTAGVLTACPEGHPPGLTRFELEERLARRIEVTDDFDRDALRETLYAPPEA